MILTYADESNFFRDLLNHIPYGVALWPSAIALAYELASRGEELAGTDRSGVGRGNGTARHRAAASFGARVVQTDRQELAMTVCKRNCQENSPNNKQNNQQNDLRNDPSKNLSNSQRNNVAAIEHRLVDWTDWRDETRYDWIIGSDILYGEPMHSPLQHIFKNNLVPGGHILLSDPFRGTSLHLLEEVASEHGWNVTASKWSLGDEDNPRPIGVFELSRGNR